MLDKSQNLKIKIASRLIIQRAQDAISMNQVSRNLGMFRPRFSVRALLGAMLVMSIVIICHVNAARRQHEARIYVSQFGGHTSYEIKDNHDADPFVVSPITDFENKSWLHKQIGIDFFCHIGVIRVRNYEFHDLRKLACLNKLEELWVENTSITDISPLESMTQLKCLDLGKTEIQSISSLRNLRKLEFVSIASTSITDIGPLSEISSLLEVDLSDTPVSNVSPLAKLHNLRTLDIRGTNISDVTALEPLTQLQIVITTSQDVKSSPAQMNRLLTISP